MKKPTEHAILNRRARFDYELGEEFVVGLVLTGPEVRAARDNHVQLKGSYVTVKNDELWLTNASFSVKHNQKGEVASATVDTSPRKLLARRKEIEAMLESKKTGMTIVPLKLLNRGRHIKIVIALGRGKKHYDKRQAIKKRDLERENKKSLK
ncbi:MAG TPA: SsrA-binding protein SmpB [Candidatus Saccharimonadales bacterium]